MAGSPPRQATESTEASTEPSEPKWPELRFGSCGTSTDVAATRETARAIAGDGSLFACTSVFSARSSSQASLTCQTAFRDTGG
mmetsp:Transcript_12922/g.35702  ORF Transcript_12922/g.35702 Transcript_12922/m.35702 type:complete len:83 (-) Transcript_12922:638-886(-)